MLIGQSALGSFLEVNPYYGPWMSRQADAATFFVEVLHLSSNASISVVLEHKNSEDPDSSATTAATFTAVSSAKVEEKAASGLKELVRYKYTVGDSSSTGWVHFRMLPPVWLPN